jgi:hypothetical protein
MTNTTGLLDLKITRLEHHLKLLEKQQALSGAYPIHLTHLQQLASRTRVQLKQLQQKRSELLIYPIMYRFEVMADEFYYR